MTDPSLYQLVDDEAAHDWADEREPEPHPGADELPADYEYDPADRDWQRP